MLSMPAHARTDIICSHIDYTVEEEPLGVVANVRNWETIVSKFELLLRYYTHFRIKTLGKGWPSRLGL